MVSHRAGRPWNAPIVADTARSHGVDEGTHHRRVHMSRILVPDIVVRTVRLALPALVALAMFSRPAFALEDCPGGSTCVYLRNSTQSVISFNVQKYYDSDNEMALGDDYWFPAQVSDLYPGEGALVVEIDDFQEIFNDTVAAFRGSLSIDGTTLSSLFVLADVAWATGGVDYSMATHAGDTWHDPRQPPPGHAHVRRHAAADPRATRRQRHRVHGPRPPWACSASCPTPRRRPAS